MINVLLVTGRDPVSDWLVTTLRSESGVVLAGAVPTLERAMSMIVQRRVDVILLDSAVPDAKQMDRLQAIVALPMSPAVILVVTPGEMPFGDRLQCLPEDPQVVISWAGPLRLIARIRPDVCRTGIGPWAVHDPVCQVTVEQCTAPHGRSSQWMTCPALSTRNTGRSTMTS